MRWRQRNDDADDTVDDDDAAAAECYANIYFTLKKRIKGQPVRNRFVRNIHFADI